MSQWDAWWRIHAICRQRFFLNPYHRCTVVLKTNKKVMWSFSYLAKFPGASNDQEPRSCHGWNLHSLREKSVLGLGHRGYECRQWCLQFTSTRVLVVVPKWDGSAHTTSTKASIIFFFASFWIYFLHLGLIPSLFLVCIHTVIFNWLAPALNFHKV